MTVRFKDHQLKPPLPLVQIFRDLPAKTLADVTTWLSKAPLEQLRSQRRVLLSAQRHVRSQSITPAPAEWSAFVEMVSNMPLVWDEAKDGRYRFKVSGLKKLPQESQHALLRSTLNQTPPGWHASLQTRQQYRYLVRALGPEFKTFDVPSDTASMSLAQSMRKVVADKFPAPQSTFIEVLAKNPNDLVSTFWPKTAMAQNTNHKWTQAAFALARHPSNEVLAQGIHTETWFTAKKKVVPDAGVSLNFFEIIQRLPQTLGRPSWMPEAFAAMLANEKEQTYIERGWKASNLNEQERFDLILSLAKHYPSNTCKQAFGELLAYDWTIPAETRKAVACEAFEAFGADTPYTRVGLMLDNAREWIGLLVPELVPLLELCDGQKPDVEFQQLQQFLQPANTNVLELPTLFNDSTEVGDLVPK